MKSVLVAVGLLVAFVLVSVGVWAIFWPAGAIVTGLMVAAGAFIIDLDAPAEPAAREVDVVDETDESGPVIARIRG